MCGVGTGESKDMGAVASASLSRSPWDVEWASGGVLLTWDLGGRRSLASREFDRDAISESASSNPMTEPSATDCEPKQAEASRQSADTANEMSSCNSSFLCE